MRIANGDFGAVYEKNSFFGEGGGVPFHKIWRDHRSLGNQGWKILPCIRGLYAAVALGYVLFSFGNL